MRDGRRAAPERLAEGVGAVGSLQPDAAAEAGDRVDDQPQPRSHSELGGDVVDRAPRQRDHLVQLGRRDDERGREGSFSGRPSCVNGWKM
jgi:hypothetical protein